jgi:CPA1 family monovalent cation:H+ antiporter
MTTADTLVVLYCIATAVAIGSRRLRVPYTVALVVAGLALGSFTHINPPRLTRELLFTFFLPGLLFEAAFHLDLSAFRTLWRSVLALAVPGVLIATGITAAIIVGAGRVLGMGDVLDWKL